MHSHKIYEHLGVWFVLQNLILAPNERHNFLEPLLGIYNTQETNEQVVYGLCVRHFKSSRICQLGSLEI